MCKIDIHLRNTPLTFKIWLLSISDKLNFASKFNQKLLEECFLYSSKTIPDKPKELQSSAWILILQTIFENYVEFLFFYRIILVNLHFTFLFDNRRNYFVNILY